MFAAPSQSLSLPTVCTTSVPPLVATIFDVLITRDVIVP